MKKREKVKNLVKGIASFLNPFNVNDNDDEEEQK